MLSKEKVPCFSMVQILDCQRLKKNSEVRVIIYKDGGDKND